MNHKVIFKTSKIVVRQLDINDESRFFELLTNYNVTKNLNSSSILISEAMAGYALKNIIAQYRTPNKISFLGVTKIADVDTIVGVVAFPALNLKEVEIFAALFPEIWGKGFSLDLLEGLIEYIFNTTKFVRIIAYVKERNKAVIYLLLKTKFTSKGLVYVARFDEYFLLYTLEKL